MEPFEIYYSERPFKDCTDRRPWIVLERRPDDIFACWPMSSHNYDGGQSFFIASDDPDFAATGLTKSCYILADHVYDLHGRELLRYKGKLDGEMLSAFRKFSGF